jgi:hypothetical protein
VNDLINESISLCLIPLHAVTFVWAIRILRRIGFGGYALRLFYVAGLAMIIYDCQALLFIHSREFTEANILLARSSISIASICIFMMIRSYASSLGVFQAKNPGALKNLQEYNRAMAQYGPEDKKAIERIDKSIECLRGKNGTAKRQ